METSSNAITNTQSVNLSPHLFSAWGEFGAFGAYTRASSAPRSPHLAPHATPGR